MLNFKTASLAFLFAVILTASIHYCCGLSLWWILLPALLYKIALIWGSSVIQSDFYIKAHCSSDTKEKVIAVTFDDGPNAVYTPAILEILKEHNAPAAFFVIGKNIAGNEHIIQQIDKAGHILGNHTFSHSFFIDLKSKKAFAAELNQTQEKIFELTGKKMRLFRPPYGVTTPNLAHAVRSLHYSVIGWSIRSFDTKADDEAAIVKRVISQIKPGAIILFHDTSIKTANVLKQTLDFAQENGFKIASVEELLKIAPYEV